MTAPASDAAQASLLPPDEGTAALPPPARDPNAPLAERLRPRTLAQVVGQQHLLSPGRPLALAAAAPRLPSMILWGPPGVGKTTLEFTLSVLQ